MSLVQTAFVLDTVTQKQTMQTVAALPVPVPGDNGYSIRANAVGGFAWSPRGLSPNLPVIAPLVNTTFYADMQANFPLAGSANMDYGDRALVLAAGGSAYREMGFQDTVGLDGTFIQFGKLATAYHNIMVTGEDVYNFATALRSFGAVATQTNEAFLKVQNGNGAIISDAVLSLTSNGAATDLFMIPVTTGTINLHFGASALDTVGYFGTAPVVQQTDPAFANALTTTAVPGVFPAVIAGVTAGGAFASQAEGDTFISWVVDNINAIRVALTAYGLIA